MEILGARALRCPTTIALCPPRHLLAAATAARGGSNSNGGGSWIDVYRLWREEGEKDAGRPLKRVASIRDCDGPFHRLAWSRGEASSEYRLGLLAGGLDGGAVRIWDPLSFALLAGLTIHHEPNVSEIPNQSVSEPEDDTTKAKLSGERRFSWSETDGSSSSASLSFIMHDFNGMPKPLTVVDKEASTVEFKDDIEPTTALMRTELDPLIKDHVTKERSSELDLQYDTEGDSKDWEFIPSEEIVSKLPDPSTNDVWNGLILKLDKLTGPVMGLAFNNQYPNMLASAAYSETLNIHYLDHPSELATRGSKQLETQMMFLEWHPFFPAILASTCDMGFTKIWDLRENSWKCRYKQDDKNKCICSEVHWNPSNPWMFAVASKDSFPMKIWDTRHSQEMLFQFGKGKGVVSFSWSACGQIITTDVDGACDCWKLDNKGELSSWSASASGVCEARWCQSESTLAALSAENLMLYNMPVERFTWPSWNEKFEKDSVVTKEC